MPNELITSPQAALILRVSHRTVHRLVRDGRLTPAQKLPGPNGAFLYRLRDIERLAKQRAQDVA